MHFPDLDRIFGTKPAVCVHVLDSKLPHPELTGDWLVLWDERAAIMEYDGGLHREVAEALAMADVVKQMREAGAT